MVDRDRTATGPDGASATRGTGRGRRPAGGVRWHHGGCGLWLELPRIPVGEGTATTAGLLTPAAVAGPPCSGCCPAAGPGTRHHREVDRAGLAG